MKTKAEIEEELSCLDKDIIATERKIVDGNARISALEKSIAEKESVSDKLAEVIYRLEAQMDDLGIPYIKWGQKALESEPAFEYISPEAKGTI